MSTAGELAPLELEQDLAAVLSLVKNALQLQLLCVALNLRRALVLTG